MLSNHYDRTIKVAEQDVNNAIAELDLDSLKSAINTVLNSDEFRKKTGSGFIESIQNYSKSESIVCARGLKDKISQATSVVDLLTALYEAKLMNRTATTLINKLQDCVLNTIKSTTENVVKNYGLSYEQIIRKSFFNAILATCYASPSTSCAMGNTK